MRQVTVAAAFIVDGSDRMLACRRCDGEQAGFWELPGGKVEPGETPEQACVREVREELSCDLESLWALEHVEHDYPDFHLSMDVFCARIAAGQEPVPSVHDELRWLTRDELLDVNWLPADVALMRNLQTWWGAIFEEH